MVNGKDVIVVIAGLNGWIVIGIVGNWRIWQLRGREIGLGVNLSIGLVIRLLGISIAASQTEDGRCNNGGFHGKYSDRVTPSVKLSVFF